MTEVFYHNCAVEDIINTVHGDEFCDGYADREGLSKRGYILIESLYDIERFRDPDWPDAHILEPMNWNDLLGVTVIPLLAADRGKSLDESLAVAEKCDAAFERCKHALEEKVYNILDDERHGPDLVTLVYDIIRIRASCGIIKESFLEKIWDVIVLGGYPCGWCGNEDGCLVVYVPPI